MPRQKAVVIRATTTEQTDTKEPPKDIDTASSSASPTSSTTTISSIGTTPGQVPASAVYLLPSPVPSPRISEDGELVRTVTPSMLTPRPPIRPFIAPIIRPPDLSDTNQIILHINVLANNPWRHWPALATHAYLDSLPELLKITIYDVSFEEVQRIQSTLNRIKRGFSCNSILRYFFCCCCSSSTVHVEPSKEYFRDTSFLLLLEKFSEQYLNYINCLIKYNDREHIIIPDYKIHGSIYKLKAILTANLELPILTRESGRELIRKQRQDVAPDARSPGGPQ